MSHFSGSPARPSREGARRRLVAEVVNEVRERVDFGNELFETLEYFVTAIRNRPRGETDRREVVPGVNGKTSRYLYDLLLQDRIVPLIRKHLDELYPPDLNHCNERTAERLAVADAILTGIRHLRSNFSGNEHLSQSH